MELIPRTRYDTRRVNSSILSSRNVRPPSTRFEREEGSGESGRLHNRERKQGSTKTPSQNTTFHCHKYFSIVLYCSGCLIWTKNPITGTNGFDVKIKNERFTVEYSRSRRNLFSTCCFVEYGKEMHRNTCREA